MIDDHTAQIIGAIIMLTGAVLVYVILDLTIHGPLWRLCDYIAAFWSDLCYWQGNQMNYNYKLVQPKEGNVMYRGNRGGYANPRYADIWLSKYIDITDPDRGRIIVKMPYFTGTIATHEWKWLATKGEYGWMEKEPPMPPPEPSIYISEGAKDEVDRILAEYAESKKPKPIVENDEKETKSEEFTGLA